MARLIVWLLAFAALTGQSSSSGFAGVWSINRQLSQFPKELGFNADWFPQPEPDGQAAAPGAGGRGRRGGSTGAPSGGAPFSGRRESYEDAPRVRLLTDETRNPPARLMIVDHTSAITVTNELGQSRTFHANAREETIDIQGVSMPVTAVRDGEQFIVVYHVEQDRDVRVTYAPAGERLNVDTEFLEHGKGEKITRVYDAGVAVTQALKAPPEAPHETFDQRPGAEFKGLKDVGILVEDLGPEAMACGLKRDAIENSLAQRLSGGGLAVKKNSDEDTYVYVNIITSGLPNGACVTRYDAFLYTHATAKLAYRDQPVLVQVSLMHRGGIASSTSAAHGAAVQRGLEGYVDLFLSQIRDANK